MALNFGTRRAAFGGETREQFVMSYGPLAYWRLTESSGLTAVDLTANAYHGTYQAAVTQAAIVGPFGKSVPYFSTLGTTFVEIDTIAPGFNGDEGTIFIAAMLIAGTWTDGNIHIAVQITQGVDYIYINKEAVNNRLRWRRTVGAQNLIRNKDGVTTTAWMILGMSWSVAGGYCQPYYQGVAEGVSMGAPNAWVGGGINAVIGAQNDLAASEWLGWLGEVILFNRPLGAVAHADLVGAYYGTP